MRKVSETVEASILVLGTDSCSMVDWREFGELLLLLSELLRVFHVRTHTQCVKDVGRRGLHKGS